MVRAVLFDFGDTLFRRDGEARAICEVAEALGASVDPPTAEEVWSRIQERARHPDELALARDLSAEAHRREWTRLYSTADVLVPGMGRALYDRETDPRKWVPYPDTAACLASLAASGVAIGVVSDTGWDIRSVFATYDLDHLVDAWVLSYEHGAVKPSASLFRAACEALGVEPEAAWMVGDNPATDGGAVEAGVPTLVLPRVADGAPRGLECVERLLSAD